MRQLSKACPLTHGLRVVLILLAILIFDQWRVGAQATTRYEAEDAELVGVRIDEGFNASGNQFADFVNPTGDYIEWTVAVPQSGSYNLAFSYALAAATKRPLELRVNGTEINAAFPSTGGWTAWTLATANTQLDSGSNKIRLSAIGSSGPNIDFLEVTDIQPQFDPIRINFSDTTTEAPNGWHRDAGLPFANNRGSDSTLSMGWLNEADNTPIDLTDYGRNRPPSPDIDIYRETFVHMDHPGENQAAKWELAVPNGTYRILVQVGDSSTENGNGARHLLRAEGVTLTEFTRNAGVFGVKNGTAVVTVSDGRLTLDQSGGSNTKLHLVIVESSSGPNTPAVLGSTPSDGATNVSVNTTISANMLHLPNVSNNGATSLDNGTINTTNVRLFEVTSGGDVGVSTTVNGTGGGDAINLTPASPLKANTRYRYVIENVKDLAGATLLPFSMEFITGSGDSEPSSGSLDNVAFEKVGTVASGERYSSLTIGPDGKLYGLVATGGQIHRWNIGSNGTLSSRQVLTTLTDVYGDRLAIGLAFAPNATASNLVAYVTHSTLTFSGGPAWDGRLSRLSGGNLQNAELLVTNLPRSVRDHLTNSIAFRSTDANVLYFLQGSNSAGGRADGGWGNRPERLLTAALLRLDLTKLPTNLPLDAQTSMDQSAINSANPNSPTMSDGTYNPYYNDAPLTLYATGIRNAYDLVWHSNGQAYVPTNGTAGGSLSPESILGTRRPDGSTYNGPSIPAVGPNEVQRDFLFRIDPSQPVGYYGHPNPQRGEYVLNRGEIDATDYPNGTQPDANYRGFAFDFEFNKSPNGVIEYKSNAHNDNLSGALLVARYSGGSDIIALMPNGANGDIGDSKIGIPGLTGFADPLDITEDVRNGNLYVSDYSRSEIVLLRPTSGGSNLPPSTSTYEAEDANFAGPTTLTGRGSSDDEYVDIQNSTGDFIEWTVNVPSSGAYEVNIQYANGSSSNRPMALRINGALSGTSPQFSPIGFWTSWGPETLTANLNSGNNTIRLTASGNSGPNFDFLSIGAAGSAIVSPRRGDVNCDNSVNAVDALYTLQYDVDLRDAGECTLGERSVDLNLASCDVNGDRDCSAVDGLLVLQCDVGIQNQLCPSE